MSELGTTTIVSVGGFIIGVVFGAVVQRTNFCTMDGISDLVLMGDGRRFRAWLLAAAQLRSRHGQRCLPDGMQPE